MGEYPMRKLIVTAGCLAIFGAGWVLGSETTVAHDGRGWKELPEVSKLMYTTGFFTGYYLAMFHSAALVAAKEPLPLRLTPAEKKNLFGLTHEAHKFRDYFQRPVATLDPLESAVSRFYDNYQNISVCWDEAFSFSILSLAGDAPTEQEVNDARKRDAQAGCK